MLLWKKCSRTRYRGTPTHMMLLECFLKNSSILDFISLNVVRSIGLFYGKIDGQFSSAVQNPRDVSTSEESEPGYHETVSKRGGGDQVIDMWPITLIIWWIGKWKHGINNKSLYEIPIWLTKKT